MSSTPNLTMSGAMRAFGAAAPEIRVKVADWAVAQGARIIATIGLGSCVAIVLHDAAANIGGLAHVLLPDASLSRDQENRAKFPDTAVPLLVAEMRKLGSRATLQAKIVGGASMFGQLLPTGGINMGERNVQSTRRALQAAGIPIVADDVGGDYGRSVYLDVASGRVLVRSLKRGDKTL
jgi:chemotaxis protein CheD